MKINKSTNQVTIKSCLNSSLQHPYNISHPYCGTIELGHSLVIHTCPIGVHSGPPVNSFFLSKSWVIRHFIETFPNLGLRYRTFIPKCYSISNKAFGCLMGQRKCFFYHECQHLNQSTVLRRKMYWILGHWMNAMIKTKAVICIHLMLFSSTFWALWSKWYMLPVLNAEPTR